MNKNKNKNENTIENKNENKNENINRHKKKSWRKILLLLVFLLGALIFFYPFISQKYYEIKANNVITNYQKEVAKLDDAEMSEKLRLSEAYNSLLQPSYLSDPFSEKEIDQGVKNYAQMLTINEQIGYIEIPKINQKLPLYIGTSDRVLQKGVGHLEGTSLPVGGNNTHTVLTAHSGLPEAVLFTALDKMEIGDEFYIHVLNRTIAYKTDQIITVEPSDFTPVSVVPDKDYATLLTCTPYMINSHRLLVRGERIPYAESGTTKPVVAEENDRYLLFVFIPLIILFLILFLWHKRKKQKIRQKNGN